MTTKAKKTYTKIDLDTRIVVVAKENPCRPGTAAHKRVGAVLRAHGKTVRDAVKAGARTSTVRYLAALKAIRAAAPARKAAA